MSRIAPLIIRVWNTAVFWTWIFNAFRFAAGLLLIPLLWKMLSKPDLGIYSLFIQFTGFLVTFDQMFALTVSRFVGYAMRGVTELQAVGIATVEGGNTQPNVVLLGRLLAVTKRIYHLLSLTILILLGVFGTLLLFPDFQKSSQPHVAWAAWGITVVSACLELYTGYWLAFMRGLNKVLLTSRLSACIYAFKLVLAVALLLAKFNLLAIPIATLFTGVLQRLLARAFLRRNMPAGVAMDFTDVGKLMRTVWPSAWRLGLILMSVNVMMVGSGLIISRKWGVEEVAPYHFSYQVLFTVCISMASVWTFVKWPLICQQRAENHFTATQRLIWPRLWLQFLTYAGLAAFFIIFGRPLLKWIAPDKHLLAWPWLVLLATYSILEMHYGFWTTLISTENRIPSMWAQVITNLSSLGLAAILVQYTNLGWGAFVLSPLLCGLAFNYWYWPGVGAHGIATTWWRFMFRPPVPEVPPQPPAARGALAT